MEQLKYLPAVLNIIPLGVVIFMWTKFDKLWDAIDAKSAKTYSDETFQRKDLCDQTVTELRNDVKEIKADVKTLLTRGNNHGEVRG